ncbi:hypothetical protein [Bifidobacterium mongoliense]|jgi:hypothetical protein|uniref:hypothetical protein n=1 Tax=Bifidobacterium mongoliense TaxID=518643 RepID=UPI0030EE1EF3
MSDHTITQVAAEKIHSMVLADGGGPGDIKPDYGYFPWNDSLKQIAQGLQGTAIWILVILFIAGVVGWLGGKFGGSGAMQKLGWGILIFCALGAALVAGAGAIIGWSTGINIFHA